MDTRNKGVMTICSPDVHTPACGFRSTAAAVDLGTNSFRLLIAEFSANTWRPLHKELVTVRLGQGLGASGVLLPEAMARGYAALAMFAEKIASCRPDSVRVCGTQALRMAANSGEFTAQASRVLKSEIEVLSGEDEARLTLLGMLSVPGGRIRHPLLLVDVGGGSSELLFQPAAAAASREVSLSLGAVALTEEFGPDIEAMAGRIRSVLARAFYDATDADQADRSLFLAGSGGTATTLAALDLALDHYDGTRVHGHVLERTRLHALCGALRALPPNRRAGLPLLGHGRGEIIVAGAMVYEELLRLSGCGSIMISDAGLLEGILLSGKCIGENVE